MSEAGQDALTTMAQPFFGPRELLPQRCEIAPADIFQCAPFEEMPNTLLVVHPAHSQAAVPDEAAELLHAPRSLC